MTAICLLLSSCSFNSVKNTKPLDISDTKLNTDNAETIIVQSPMTISNNSIENKTVRIKLKKGRYYENWNPGPIIGTIWEGDFYIEVTEESGNVLSTFELPQIHTGDLLLFASPFEIVFDDYNDDGDMDFIIEQYATSNGRDYKLFTIRKDGNIEELVINKYPYLFISDTTGCYSTKLEKVNNTTFKKVYYDNSKGKWFEDFYIWNGNAFNLFETKETKIIEVR